MTETPILAALRQPSPCTRLSIQVLTARACKSKTFSDRFSQIKMAKSVGERRRGARKKEAVGQASAAAKGGRMARGSDGDARADGHASQGHQGMSRSRRVRATGARRVATRQDDRQRKQRRLARRKMRRQRQRQRRRRQRIRGSRRGGGRRRRIGRRRRRGRGGQRRTRQRGHGRRNDVPRVTSATDSSPISLPNPFAIKFSK